MWGLAIIKPLSVVAGLMSLAIAALPYVAVHNPAMPETRSVTLPAGTELRVAVREVTRREWQACVEAGACAALAPKPRTGEPDMPMTGVNHLDVEAYLRWVNAAAATSYRLPTSSEWQVIAADLPVPVSKRIFTDPRLSWAADYGAMKRVSAVLRASGSFGTFANGIADLEGNVWEWTSTCTLKGAEPDRCPAYVAEGLHEAVVSVFVRDPASGGCAVGAPPANLGFRLVSDG